MTWEKFTGTALKLANWYSPVIAPILHIWRSWVTRFKPQAVFLCVWSWPQWILNFTMWLNCHSCGWEIHFLGQSELTISSGSDGNDTCKAGMEEELDDESWVLWLPLSIFIASWMAISTSCILGLETPCSSTLRTAISAILQADSILNVPISEGSMILVISPLRIDDLACKTICSMSSLEFSEHQTLISAWILKLL